MGDGALIASARADQGLDLASRRDGIAPSVTPMSDTRAPTDDRQSLLHRYRWQLEALRCGLADSMQALREAEAVLAQLHGLQRAARNGAAAVRDRLDPLHLRAVVAYLGQLVERIKQQTRHRDQLISLCSLKRRDCAEAEAQLAEVEAQLAKLGDVRDDHTLAPRGAPSPVIEMMLPGA